MTLLKNEKYENPLKIIVLLGIVFCCAVFFPEVRNFIIETGEKVLGRNLNHWKWMSRLLAYSICAIFFFACILMCVRINVQSFLAKYGKTLIIVSAVIVVISIVVRIIMYVKCRSLWLDEAHLAANFVLRNWSELLTPPLDNNQAAPVFYVIAVKIIGLLLGYSEVSLRIFSLFSFVGLLICEIVFLKGAFRFTNFKIAFVVVMTALLPAYIWYSNELKPYMSDAFFVILAILTYALYLQKKMNLPTLTILYILFLGFSFPALFFIGGILFSEFFAAVLDKNKKQVLFSGGAGMIILIVFGLYYYWWMSPVTGVMKGFWDVTLLETIKRIPALFSPRIDGADSGSPYVIYFVPFALLGMLHLRKTKSRLVYSVMVSLFFAFLASFIGMWPMISSFWLFLPAIIFVFTPAGFNFIQDIVKVEYKNKIDTLGLYLSLLIVVLLSINCLRYTGDKSYFRGQEVNPLIYYVQNNITKDEKVYIYPGARDTFGFKNGYAAEKIGNGGENNIIYGINRDEWAETVPGNELQMILDHKKVYLIFQHHWFGINGGLEILRNCGTITEVMNVHETPLYYFERAY